MAFHVVEISARQCTCSDDKDLIQRVMDSNGDVVGLFRYKTANSRDCFAISAIAIREYGYEICGGEQTFQAFELFTMTSFADPGHSKVMDLPYLMRSLI